MVAHVLDVEAWLVRQAGLLSNDKVRKDFEALRATIKSGGK